MMFNTHHTLLTAQGDDAAQQHQHAKEMLQLTEWMAAVGQGDKEMLVRFGMNGVQSICHLRVQAYCCMATPPPQRWR